MERLTYKNQNNNRGEKTYDRANLSSMIRYFITHNGITKDQIIERHNALYDALKVYEDAEEAGLLPKYRPLTQAWDVYGNSFIIRSVEIYSDAILYRCGNKNKNGEWNRDYAAYYESEFGEKVFTTKAEADADFEAFYAEVIARAAQEESDSHE